MKQKSIGMKERFRTSGTSHHSLTTHHCRRNSSPESHPNALKAVLTPATRVDFPMPRQRTSDSHRDRILVLGRLSVAIINYPILSTYLSRSPGPKLFQPWEPSGQVLEQPTNAVVIPSPRQDTPGVTIREHHCPAHAHDLLDGTHQDGGSWWSQISRVVGIRTQRLILQPRGLL